MMSIKLVLVVSIAIVALTACDKRDKTVDRGVDSGHLRTHLKAGVWIDPNGCDHWIIDDGVEGYLSARLGPDGKPVCSGSGVPGSISGPFKKGFDPI